MEHIIILFFSLGIAFGFVALFYHLKGNAEEKENREELTQEIRKQACLIRVEVKKLERMLEELA